MALKLVVIEVTLSKSNFYGSNHMRKWRAPYFHMLMYFFSVLDSNLVLWAHQVVDAVELIISSP